uniref:Uncharacterized protein n=1 Tax=Globisporangium ultimum (strain ATCC 200006 / CBS 805.95 / DAOM BR144) TaxID=431595 RepID=K3WYD0_GLOUD
MRQIRDVAGRRGIGPWSRLRVPFVLRSGSSVRLLHVARGATLRLSLSFS